MNMKTAPEEVLKKFGDFKLIEARHMHSMKDTKFVTPESAIIAMIEYAQQARNEAIDNCIAWYSRNSPVPSIERIAELENLKK